jgi:hypothetical protein
MSVKSLRRAAALTLLVLLAAASSAQAASAASPSGILELLWGQIAGSLSKAGCTVDPNGILCAKEGSSPDPNGAQGAKVGCSPDPNGGTCSKHLPAITRTLWDLSGRTLRTGIF